MGNKICHVYFLKVCNTEPFKLKEHTNLDEIWQISANVEYKIQVFNNTTTFQWR